MSVAKGATPDPACRVAIDHAAAHQYADYGPHRKAAMQLRQTLSHLVNDPSRSFTNLNFNLKMYKFRRSALRKGSLDGDRRGMSGRNRENLREGGDEAGRLFSTKNIG